MRLTAPNYFNLKMRMLFTKVKTNLFHLSQLSISPIVDGNYLGFT
jgi:hypothetical protein